MTEKELNKLGFCKDRLDKVYSLDLNIEVRMAKSENATDLIRKVYEYGINYGVEIGKNELKQSINNLLKIEE